MFLRGILTYLSCSFSMACIEIEIDVAKKVEPWYVSSCFYEANVSDVVPISLDLRQRMYDTVDCKLEKGGVEDKASPKRALAAGPEGDSRGRDKGQGNTKRG